MKIGEIISTLGEAKEIQEYLKDRVENTLEIQCTMPKAVVEDATSVIEKLVRFIKDCEM